MPRQKSDEPYFGKIWRYFTGIVFSMLLSVSASSLSEVVLSAKRVPSLALWTVGAFAGVLALLTAVVNRLSRDKYRGRRSDLKDQLREVYLGALYESSLNPETGNSENGREE
jgi:hypothetical protein